FRDLAIFARDHRAAVVSADALDERPAQQPGSLFWDLASVRHGVGLAMLGCQPGPRTQMLRGWEPGDVTDLRHDDRRDRGPDTTDRLHRPVTAMATQMRADVTFEFHDLSVVDRDHLAERLHPQRVVAGELELIELTVPCRAEHVHHAGQHS